MNLLRDLILLAAEILKEKIIAENKKGRLVFITSHLFSELDDLVTHVVMMQEGEIRFHMPTDPAQGED